MFVSIETGDLQCYAHRAECGQLIKWTRLLCFKELEVKRSRVGVNLQNHIKEVDVQNKDCLH